jgi:hypothetical protein
MMGTNMAGAKKGKIEDKKCFSPHIDDREGAEDSRMVLAGVPIKADLYGRLG